MTRREIAMYVWERHLNQPYRWGGDNPLTGFDCSGFALEGLKAAGLFPRDEDMTADDLLRHLYRNRPRLADHGLKPGCLVFWGDGGRAIHVEVIWAVDGTRAFTIGASGGGRQTTDLAAAITQDAYIKIRPLRSGWMAAIDPFPED